MWYRLEGKTPVLCDDVIEAMHDISKRVAAKTIHVPADRAKKVKKNKPVWVSTIFLALDHQRHEDAPPLLFETCIFGGELHQELTRCSTWEQAEQMHKGACERVKMFG